MGVCYYGICHGCKQYIDLDKFYSFASCEGAVEAIANLDKEDLAFYQQENFTYRSLRLFTFMHLHKGHCVEVQNEHDFFELREYEYDKWKEVYPWPRPNSECLDLIHWDDPKAGRLIIRTRLGEITLDYLPQGINCFRFVNGERVDTLLLPSN